MKTRKEFFDYFVSSFTDYAIDLTLAQIRSELNFDKNYMADERGSIHNILLNNAEDASVEDMLKKGFVHYTNTYSAMGLSNSELNYIAFSQSDDLTEAMLTIMFSVARNIHLIDALVSKFPEDFKEFVNDGNTGLLPERLSDDDRERYMNQIEHIYKELGIIYTALNCDETKFYNVVSKSIKTQ